METQKLKKDAGRLSLTQLAEELERQRKAKVDFTADTRQLEVIPHETTGLAFTVPEPLQEKVEAAVMPINNHALRQLGSTLGIPAPFVDKLKDNHPDMLAWTVNELFRREPKARMVRTLDGVARAFMSDSYRPLDNFDLAEAVLPELIRMEADVFSCAITETRMYIKAIIPGVVREVKADGVFFGDGGHHTIHVLKPGCVIGNSEVGAGSLFFQPGVHEKHCSNLAIFSRDAMRKFHVGRKQNGDDDIWTILSEETRRVQDAGFWMQVRDMVRASFEGKLFEKMVRQCEEAIRGEQVEAPIEAIKLLPDTSVTQAEQDGILTFLVKGGDLSQFGMQAAVTRFAQEVESPDRQFELEQLGGKILELPRNQWKRIAEAGVQRVAA